MAGESIAMGKRKIHVLFWDGAIPWLVKKLMEEGCLPNLQALQRKGLSAGRALAPFPNCETPAGFATLLTGAEEKVHQVYGYRVPKKASLENTILQTESGFLTHHLKAEPFWIPLAERGKKILLVHIPFSCPLSPWGRAPEILEHITAFNGYEGVPQERKFQPYCYDSAISSEQGQRKENVFWEGVGTGSEFLLEKNGSLKILLLSSPHPMLVLRDLGGEAIRLSLQTPQAHLPLDEKMGCFLQLLHLDLEKNTFLLWRSAAWKIISNKKELESPFYAGTGPFLGMPAFSAASGGGLGKGYFQGGPLEEFLCQTMEALCEYFHRSSQVALELCPEAEISLHYQPGPDLAEHCWLGYIDPQCSLFQKGESYQFYWSLMRRIYKKADAHLGFLLEKMGPEDFLFLISDHGQRGIGKNFHINLALSQAGVVKVEKNGQVNLAESKAIYSPSGIGYIVVNSTKYKKGFVKEEEIEPLLEEIKKILRGLKCPESGLPVVKTILEKKDLFPGAPGELFLIPTGDYHFTTEFTAPGLVGPPHILGSHREPLPASQEGIFYSMGPRITPGFFETMDNQNLAATLCELLEVPPPKDSSGKSIF